MIKYSISILALDNIDLTRRCIDSVMHNSKDYELILTDNGSTDGTKEYFESLYRQNPEIVTVISHDQNLGFQRPNIEALAIAEGALFVLLNNDSEVPPHWLELLEAPFKENPNAALSGPIGTCCALRPDFNGYPSRNFEYLEGSCLMCKTEIVRKHGLFSPSLYFAYSEDSDLSLRMRELGYSIHQVPFTLKHQQGATSRMVPGIDEIRERNNLVMQKRWGHYLKTRKLDYPIVLKRTAAIGDVLLLTPIIRALKEQRPLSPIGVHTQWPELFLWNSNVAKADKHLQVPKDALVYDLDGCYEARIETHIVDSFAEAVGLEKWDRRVEMFPSASDIKWAGDQLIGDEWVAVHASPTTWIGKNWPVERFAGVIKWLRENGWNVALVGNHPMNVGATAVVMTPSLIQLAAVLRRCRLFIGTDSAPAHIASAVGTQSIVLFGITSPEYIVANPDITVAVRSDTAHPYSGARHKQAGATYVHCESNPMETITETMVIEAAQKALSK